MYCPPLLYNRLVGVIYTSLLAVRRTSCLTSLFSIHIYILALLIYHYLHINIFVGPRSDKACPLRLPKASARRVTFCDGLCVPTLHPQNLLERQS